MWAEGNSHHFSDFILLYHENHLKSNVPQRSAISKTNAAPRYVHLAEKQHSTRVYSVNNAVINDVHDGRSVSRIIALFCL